MEQAPESNGGLSRVLILQEIAQWLTLHPLLAPLLFVLLYVVVVLSLLPGVVLCVTGGALFGIWFGTLLNLIGATLGGSLAFLVARHLAAEQVERHMSASLKQLKQGVEAEGWRFVAMVRLLPMVPYNLSSYAFGLSRISLGTYALTNALCILPRLFVYAYIGHSGAALLQEEEDRLLNLLALVSLLLAIVLIPHIYQRLRPPR